MNGTALYEALTVIFIAQLHGVEMTGNVMAMHFAF
jgi:Na+/H+-dicarboxylate symporter